MDNRSSTDVAHLCRRAQVDLTLVWLALLALHLLLLSGCPGGMPPSGEPGEVYGKCPPDGAPCDADGCLLGPGPLDQCFVGCETDDDCPAPGSCVRAEDGAHPVCVITCSTGTCPDGYTCSGSICWPE